MIAILRVILTSCKIAFVLSERELSWKLPFRDCDILRVKLTSCKIAFVLSERELSWKLPFRDCDILRVKLTVIKTSNVLESFFSYSFGQNNRSFNMM